MLSKVFAFIAMTWKIDSREWLRGAALPYNESVWLCDPSSACCKLTALVTIVGCSPGKKSIETFSTFDLWKLWNFFLINCNVEECLRETEKEKSWQHQSTLFAEWRQFNSAASRDASQTICRCDNWSWLRCTFVCYSACRLHVLPAFNRGFAGDWMCWQIWTKKCLCVPISKLQFLSRWEHSTQI